MLDAQVVVIPGGKKPVEAEDINLAIAEKAAKGFKLVSTGTQSVAITGMANAQTEVYGPVLLHFEEVAVTAPEQE